MILELFILGKMCKRDYRNECYKGKKSQGKRNLIKIAHSTTSAVPGPTLNYTKGAQTTSIKRQHNTRYALKMKETQEKKT